MRDHDRGPSGEGRPEGELDGHLGLRVEMRRRLVQHHDVGRLQEQPGDGDPLLLAARQPVAPIADHRIQAGRKRVDERHDLRRPQRLDELVGGSVGLRVQEVRADRVVEEMRVLGHHANDPVDRVEGGIPHVDPVDPDGARPHVVKTRDQVADRGLARARWPDQRDQLTRPGDERDVVEHLLRGGLVQHGDGLEGRQGDFLGPGVAEVDVVELDGRRAGRDGRRARLLGDHRLEVQHLEHAVEADERGHDVDLDVRERGEWPVEPVQVGGERDDRADLQGTIGGEDAAPPVDEGGGERGGEQDRHHEHPRIHGLRDPDVPDASRLLLEAPDLADGLPEQLHEKRPRDVEALGHHRDHLRVEVVALAGDRLHAVAHPSGGQQDHRQQGQRDQGDLPGQQRHRDQGDDDAHDVADHR